MKFKLRLVKQPTIDVPYEEVPKGIYQQLRGGKHVLSYNKTNFSLDTMKQAIGDLYVKDPTRTVKLYTNQAGKDMFDKALMNELKNFNKNEYRKRINIKSQIFKQIDKLRQ